MSGYEKAAFDIKARYNKAYKEIYRFTIADNRGLLRLTVPVSRPSGATLWSQTLVSDHGRWFETMPTALETAYGRTPFFEFYIDRMMPLFDMRQESVTDLCLRADAIVRGILKLPVEIISQDSDESFDIFAGDSEIEEKFNTALPYWQVRQESFGFMPGLSILDLIFNLGPEAELYLDRLRDCQQPMLKTLQ